jgi:hypothetical protein
VSTEGHRQNEALVPLEYRGELVALVSARRFHLIAPWLAVRPPGDPDLRFVAYMCACYAEVASGNLAGPFSDQLAERWARNLLVDEVELRKLDRCTDAELAARWNMPTEQVRRARAERTSS